MFDFGFFVILSDRVRERSGCMCVRDRVTRFGNFLKFSPTKVAQMIGNFLGNVEKPHFYAKTEIDTFWATFGNL